MIDAPQREHGFPVRVYAPKSRAPSTLRCMSSRAVS
jgi:hypothetical protein